MGEIGMRPSMLLALAFAVHLANAPAQAQDYPSRPVRIINPFPAGTAADISARLLGARMAQILGQQFVIENRPGGGTSLGAAAAARAPADCYTLFNGSITNIINAAMNPNLPFDYIKDFTPIILYTTT